jgi:hypothetical protein
MVRESENSSDRQGAVPEHGHSPNIPGDTEMVAWTLTYATGCAYSGAGLNAECGAWYSPWPMCCCWGDGMYCACCGPCGARVTRISGKHRFHLRDYSYAPGSMKPSTFNETLQMTKETIQMLLSNMLPYRKLGTATTGAQ